MKTIKDAESNRFANLRNMCLRVSLSPWNKCVHKVSCHMNEIGGSSMDVQENVQLVKDAYAAFGRGDMT